MENERKNCVECGWPDGQCDCKGEPPVRSSDLDGRRASCFFTADVSETVDYVLDQAAMHSTPEFVDAVIKALKPWREKPPNEKGKE